MEADKTVIAVKRRFIRQNRELAKYALSQVIIERLADLLQTQLCAIHSHPEPRNTKLTTPC